MALVAPNTGAAVTTPVYYSIVSAFIRDMGEQGFRVEEIALHFFGMSFVEEGDELKCNRAFEKDYRITFVKPGELGLFELRGPFADFYGKLVGNGTFAEVKCMVEMTGFRHIKGNTYDKKVRTVELAMKGPLRAELPASQPLFLE